MRKFFLVYGVLLFGLFVAFSYFDSKTKDHRILTAKMDHAVKLIRDQQCLSAFALLSQKDHKILADFYNKKADVDLEEMEQQFCAQWKGLNTKQDILTFNIPDTQLDQGHYNVKLVNDSEGEAMTLHFEKTRGELALVGIE